MYVAAYSVIISLDLCPVNVAEMYAKKANIGKCIHIIFT